MSPALALVGMLIASMWSGVCGKQRSTAGTEHEYKHGELLRTKLPNALALTFDDGPDANWTPKVLDLLRQHDVKATFFIVGQLSELRPDLVRRYVAEGHAIGVHTWDHPDLRQLRSYQIRRQIAKTLQVIGDIVPNVTVQLFRPPQGLMNKKVSRAVHGFNLSVVMWSLDTKDWKINTSEISIANVVNTATPKSIVLMHDGIDATDQLYSLGKKNFTSGFEGITRTDKNNVVTFLKNNLDFLRKKYKLVLLGD